MDFSKLEFNPTVLEEGEYIWEKYEDLLVNPAFCELTQADVIRGVRSDDLSKVVSFVILYVDYNSPFYKRTDLEDRISACAKAAGIKPGSLAMDEISSHSNMYSKVLYEYFRMQNSILFEDWLSLKTTLSEFYKYLRSPIGLGADIDAEAVKRSQVQKNIEGLKKKVLEAEAKLFPTRAIQDQINRENIKDSLTGFAERYAQHHPSLKSK